MDWSKTRVMGADEMGLLSRQEGLDTLGAEVDRELDRTVLELLERDADRHERIERYCEGVGAYWGVPGFDLDERVSLTAAGREYLSRPGEAS